MTRCQQLRQFISRRQGPVVPGASDGVSVKLAEELTKLIGVTERLALGRQCAE